MMTTPYRVEVDKDGCETCGHGRMWTIVGPDNVALGESWGDKEFVDDIAQLLNEAYDAGRAGLGAADAEPRVIRVRFRVLGGHVHCRLFTAAPPYTTFAKSGDLVFNLTEWPDIRTRLINSVEFIEEGPA